MYHPARCQKHTSRYICITPLLVKLAYFLPPKKLWCDTYVSFFWQEPNTCTRRAVQRQAAGRIRTFSSVLSELFLRVFCVFRALAAAREQSRALLFRCARSLLLAEITSAKPLLSLLLTSSPLSNILRISVHAKPAAAHRALLFQPLTQTTHSSEGLSFGNPLWQNPKSSP